ncbi:MAG: TAXI family TRAP transporter solute-binding subunit [Burkholderiaceae bacterium]
MPGACGPRAGTRARSLRTLLNWWLVSFAALIAAEPAPAQQPPQSQHLVTIGSGEYGGVYFPAAGALCRLLNRETGRHGIRCVAEPSRGSLQNVADLLDDRTDFGIVQTDIQADAVLGRGRFAKKGPQHQLRALFALHAEPITVLARLDAGSGEIQGLRGDRVALGQPTSGTRATMSMLLDALSMTEADFSAVADFGPQVAGTALCENRIDAFAYVVGHPNHLVRGVSESCAIRIVAIRGPAIDALLARHPYMTQARIAGGLYVGVDESVPTIGVRASVLTTDRLDEQAAYEITRAVGENLQALGDLHPALAGLRIDDLRAGMTAPLHPGAARYFAERLAR